MAPECILVVDFGELEEREWGVVVAASMRRASILWFKYLVLVFELALGVELKPVAFPDVEPDASALYDVWLGADYVGPVGCTAVFIQHNPEPGLLALGRSLKVFVSG